ncbi:unnamed protein product, partial [Brenthis ino]
MRVLGIILLFLFTSFKTINNEEFLKSTLTTASVRPSTSQKPTTLYRRINVQDGIWSASLDFNRFMDARRKKSNNNKNSFLSNLDTWCQFQPKIGNCEKSLQKFYYDLQLHHCVPFNYSGCGGNRNNFETLADCEQLCNGVFSYSVEQASYKTICMLQPQSGMCMAMIPKYYYDTNEKTCKKFIYGGCGGNLNKFDTFSSCLNACGDSDF